MPLKDPLARKAYRAAEYAKNPKAAKARAKAWRKANPKKAKKRDAAYYRKNKSRLTAQNKIWADANREKMKAVKHAHYLRNKKRIKARSKAWRRRHKKIVKVRQLNNHLQREYGVTSEQVFTILEAQGWKCALPSCTTAIKRLGKREGHTDHDHLTGAVRGILCAQHNHGLGAFERVPVQLEEASAYLRTGAARIQALLGHTCVPKGKAK
jgi:hypothetical protein